MSRPQSPLLRRLSSSRLVMVLSPRSWMLWLRSLKQARRERRLQKVLRQRDLLLEPVVNLQERLLAVQQETLRRLLMLERTVLDQQGRPVPPSPELLEQRELLLEVLNSLQQKADAQISQQLGLPPRRM